MEYYGEHAGCVILPRQLRALTKFLQFHEFVYQSHREFQTLNAHTNLTQAVFSDCGWHLKRKRCHVLLRENAAEHHQKFVHPAQRIGSFLVRFLQISAKLF